MSRETSSLQSMSDQRSEDDRSVVSNFNDPSSFSPTTSTARRKKHVTTACDLCRKSKAKCDGKQPCGRCREKTYNCVYAPEEDNRNRGPMKRRLAELEADLNIFYALLETIRTSSEPTIAEIIELIRKGATTGEIGNYLSLNQSKVSQMAIERDSLAVSSAPTPSSSSTQPEVMAQSPFSAIPLVHGTRQVSFSLPRRVFGVSRLTDMPIYRVPASPWTTVVDDDDLVSHLVSLYATWEHVFFDGVVLELFIRDMRSQDAASYFCSSFLVNCILATACPYSDFDEVRTSLGSTSILMNLFIEQADSLFSVCQTVSIITAAQGLCVLSVASKKQNNESRSQQYVQQALSIFDTLLVAKQNLVATILDQQLRGELLYTISSTVFGIFHIAGIGLIGWNQRITIQPPLEIINESLMTWQPSGNIWQAYPISSQRTESLYDEARQYFASLSLLSYEWSKFLPEINLARRGDLSAEPAKRQQLRNLSTQLINWLSRLPSQFSGSVPAFAISAILLRWWVSYIMMTLCRAQMKLQAGLEVDNTIQQMDQAPGKESGPESTQGLHPKQNLTEFARDTVALLHSFKITAIDYSRIHPFISITLCEALLVFAETNADPSGLVDGERRNHDAEIVTICEALRDMARRNPNTASLARSIGSDIYARDLVLPGEALRYLNEIDPANAIKRSR